MYELHKENCPILPWCWFAVYPGYKPHLSEYSKSPIVKKGGVYVAGFKTQQEAQAFGLKKGWIAL